MNEMILTMLQSILSLAVALLSAYAVRWFNAKTAQAKSAVDNETAQRYVGEASDAITSAVLATSQTYVDTLKKSGTFTAENQKEALKLATQTAMASMTEGAEQFLQTAYGDVTKYLETKIEAEIKALSSGMLIGESLNG